MESPAFAVTPQRGLHSVQMPTTVAALEGADGRIVLVDTGLSDDQMARPIRELGPSGALIRYPGETASVASQMAIAGLSPSRVVAIVATHLHFDHIGAYVDFPNAEIVAPAAEFASGRKLGLRKGYVHVPKLLRSGQARPFVWSGAAREGFPAHRDLFGDGRVILFDARGHTAGSVAVWLNDPESGKSVLMAGDAAYTRDEYRNHRKSWLMRFVQWRDAYVRATWGRLHAFENAHPDSPVVPSHDYHAWCEVCGHG